MSTSLVLDRVDRLSVRVSYCSVLEGPPHDVFVLDVRPGGAGDTFDETPYLDALEPVLHTHGEASDPCTVHVTRTHRSWTAEAGEAEIAIALATGRSTTVDRAASASVASAFRKVLELSAGGGPPDPLDHHDALAEARQRVERAYAEVHADLLAVTDEEHVAVARTWSVGMSLPTRGRFQVLLGFVDGDSRSTHIRRLPGGEVVDSVGTGGDG